MENTKNDTKDRELCLSRTLDAPVALVWEMFTDPKHVANWWGPNGFTNTIHKMEVRPGGEWSLVMHGPDGRNYDNQSFFTEIVPYQKIAFKHVSHPPIVFTITFEDRGDKTLLNWHMLFESAEEFIKAVKAFGADEGLKQNIEKLTLYLAKQGVKG